MSISLVIFITQSFIGLSLCLLPGTFMLSSLLPTNSIFRLVPYPYQLNLPSSFLLISWWDTFVVNVHSEFCQVVPRLATISLSTFLLLLTALPPVSCLSFLLQFLVRAKLPVELPFCTLFSPLVGMSLYLKVLLLTSLNYSIQSALSPMLLDHNFHFLVVLIPNNWSRPLLELKHVPALSCRLVFRLTADIQSLSGLSRFLVSTRQ